MTRTLLSWPGGRRLKWLVLAAWIGLLIVLQPLAGKLGDVESNDAAAWLPGNAESTEVLELSEKFQPADTSPTVIVYDRPSGITAADEAKARADATHFADGTGVVGEPYGPVRSDDGKALRTVVNVHLGKDGWEGLNAAAKDMRAIARPSAPDGLGVHVTGPTGYAADSAESFSSADFKLTLVTLLIVVTILVVTYRSPLLWLLPMISAGMSLVISQAIVYLLAKNAGLTVNAQTAMILTVLVLGAATDYALLLVARYREELRRHEDRHEAMAVALRRAGPAIVASAATVAVSMLVLLLAALNSTKGLGPVCAVGVLVGLLSMMTLLPALLVIFGRWVFWPARPKHGTEPDVTRGLWSRIARLVSGRPRAVWVTTSLLLGAVATLAVTLNADGLQQKDGFKTKPESVVGEEILTRHFPAGSGEPMVVIAKGASADQVHAALETVPGVIEVAPPQVKDGLAYVEATLGAGADSPAAMRSVTAARETLARLDGAQARVGGSSAVVHDMREASSRDRGLIIPVILAVVFCILALLLRALVAPLLLIASVVLSFFTALGLAALFFNHVFDFAGADSAFPLWVFVFLVALGVDYNIFLVTRIKEESDRLGTRQGALKGLTSTGGVITAAGLVLAGTFAALATLPLVFIAELGFTVAVGVLLDTMIVRSVLVTALTLDVGRWMWWPHRLARREDPSEDPAVSGMPDSIDSEASTTASR
ncbi:MMPL family transporter [Streptomyces anthocyanicus]|uniref:MMPL family transporter n=1 Tax=Streptomyces TaxID=1883 RepID=UPI0029AA3FEA|nr:MMPL family transporter [Streptomyces sp. ME02-6979A]MDX3346809.1 MMPL family transporter [Streptomyces sp. ME02-6979A]